jgi:8-oxo-dGTP pyrophosphatase MutT (NUDIX family)
VRTTWDGLPITDEAPHGASVVVRRPDGAVLLLHRAHHGPDFAGDWAWTPPAGSRQPGEPILPSTLRELAEEAGITSVTLRPVDLSGSWAHFATEVDQDTRVTLVDPEHDGFAWVPPEEAYRRCRPAVVADGVRRAVHTPSHDVEFAPMTRAILPAMHGWLQTPHVARWWHEDDVSPAAIEAKYLPRIDGDATVRVDVVTVGGRPVGFIQSYPVAGDSEYNAAAAAATGGGQTVGIDYAIGDAGLIGAGLGTQMIWAYARDVVIARWPASRFVVADPDPANVASVRALEKVGFRPAGRFADEDGDHVMSVLDRRRVFGSR